MDPLRSPSVVIRLQSCVIDSRGCIVRNGVPLGSFDVAKCSNRERAPAYDLSHMLHLEGVMLQSIRALSFASTLLVCLVAMQPTESSALYLVSSNPSEVGQFHMGATVENFDDLPALTLTSYLPGQTVPAANQFSSRNLVAFTSPFFNSGGASFNDPVGNPGTRIGIFDPDGAIAGDVQVTQQRRRAVVCADLPIVSPMGSWKSSSPPMSSESVFGSRAAARYRYRFSASQRLQQHLSRDWGLQPRRLRCR